MHSKCRVYKYMQTRTYTRECTERTVQCTVYTINCNDVNEFILILMMTNPYRYKASNWKYEAMILTLNLHFRITNTILLVYYYKHWEPLRNGIDSGKASACNWL